MAADLKPKFSLPDTTPKSSKKELIISGIKVYVYGLDELVSELGVDLAVLYLGHGRTGSYEDAEIIAQQLLHDYRSDVSPKKMELIAVCFDLRNHGERLQSQLANWGWSDGNINFGLDMISIMHGSCQDISLVMDYLPDYIPGFKAFYNYVSGVSLGGHIAWRMPQAARQKIQGESIIIGCPNMTSLLLNRLGVSLDGIPPEQWYKVLYDQLPLTEHEKRNWPKNLSMLVANSDKIVDESFPQDIQLLIQNGAEDELVPSKYTVPWVSKNNRDNVKFIVHERTGHTVTSEMVDNIGKWLIKLLEV